MEPTALLSGGSAIPLGFLFGMPALGVYAAAVMGAVIGMVVFAFVGGGLRTLDREPDNDRHGLYAVYTIGPAILIEITGV